jgi:hypothetical protein
LKGNKKSFVTSASEQSKPDRLCARNPNTLGAAFFLSTGVDDCLFF